jgi:hypothetical protein
MFQINTTILCILYTGKFHHKGICNRLIQTDSTNIKRSLKTLKLTTSLSMESPSRLSWSSTSPTALIYWSATRQSKCRMTAELFKETRLADTPSESAVLTTLILLIKKTGNSQVLHDQLRVRTCPNVLGSRNVLNCSNPSSTSVPIRWEQR